MNGMRHGVRACLAVSALCLHLTSSGAARNQSDWTAYGGGPEQTRYSRLAQINKSNVRDLVIAWSFDCEEEGGLQTNPIVVDGVLYTTTPKHKVIALDAATGVLRWRFDPKIEGRGPNRGVTYWANGSERRVFAASEHFVYALDARTGVPIASFAENGRIDLRADLGRIVDQQFVRLTTPGVIYKDLLIVGGRVGEGTGASPGYIRAYDAKSGKLRWRFNTIPQPGEFGYETWSKDSWTVNGGANNWAGMAVDETRGVVYVPTGSAAPDFYGADRVGDNLFANTVLALKADTGKRLWHFQAVRHDIWDRDFPSPPTLVTVTHQGRRIEGVAQTTKHGYVFLFDRDSGKPLFPVEQRQFPSSSVAGEVAAATQPLPIKPAPFARQTLTEATLTNRTPDARKWAVEEFRRFAGGDPFVPLRVGQETIVFPGFDGGAEWGGSAFDPESGLLYVNANDLAWTGSLAPKDYSFTGYKRFLDPDGYPATAPPWGTLNAINFNTGEYAWKIPLGEYPELAAAGMKDTGTENYGGPIVTAGGLVFIAATNFDRKFRAFDKDTGALLWETTLPLAGNATPATYEVNGRQFVVVPAGGGKSKDRSGGIYVAFAIRSR